MAAEQTINHSQPYSLRPVNADDESFLRTVYASTREMELAQTPWSEAQRAAFTEMQFKAQSQHYLKFYPHATHDIILAGEQAAGRLYVDRRDEEIHLLDIALLPAFRGQGIGAALIKALMQEAAAAGKALSVYVETFNPSQILFKRMGFRVKEDDGINLLFEWRPDSDATAQDD